MALFLTWMTVDEYTLGLLISSTSFNGIDIVNLDGSDFQKYIPAVTLVLSAIMLAVALIPGSKIAGRTSSLIVLVLGIIILVCAILFALWIGHVVFMNEAVKTGGTATLGIGFFLIAGAGALGLIGGLMNIIKKE